MQQLSVRLESVFELVRESRTSLGRGRVIDIGSDHGFLSVRCLEEGVSDHAVCTDIHEAPAQKSRSSLIMAGFKDKCTVIVTDGMDGIELQPNDIVVTAGMGGLNIIDIFTRITDNTEDKILKDCGYVVQSQKSTHLVRRFFAERGYRIADETVCKDRGFFYNVMRPIPVKIKLPIIEGMRFEKQPYKPPYWDKNNISMCYVPKNQILEVIKNA